MVVFDALERSPWILAPGSLADSNTASGNVPVAAQKQPLVECASFSIDPKGQSYANAYWYKVLGADATKTQFEYEASFLFPSAADAAASQAIELDIQQTISGVTFNWGLQFDFAENLLRVWNRAAKAWKATGYPSPRWLAETWMQVRLLCHRDSTSVHYDLLTFNGTDMLLAELYPSAQVGEKAQINCAVQLDSNSSGTPYTLVLDDVSLTTN